MNDVPYCIIGAGPCGLSQARALLFRGVPFELVERHQDVGGIWDMDNPGSPMYESAHFISSRKMSGFPGFPMPESYPDYPSRQQILDYLRAFADRYQLREHIRFGKSVTRVVPDGEGATVWVDGEPRRYGGVVCATGINWVPHVPKFEGTFTGLLRHSSSYRHARELEGKRVLVVGLGNSGADIACDIVGRAASVTVSIRRGYYMLPKHIFGVPADEFGKGGVRLPLWLEVPIFQLMQRWLVGDTTRLGMPKPTHRILEAHPLVNDQLLHHLRHGNLRLTADVARFEGSRVHFRDGHAEEFDEVLLCTGYQRALPYLEERYIERERSGIAHVLTVFSRQYPTLFTLGYAEGNGALFPHADLLAALTAQYAHARKHDPGRAAAFRKLIETTRWDVRGARQLIDSPRHHGYCDTDTLRKYAHRAFRQMGWQTPTAAEYASFLAAPDTHALAAAPGKKLSHKSAEPAEL